MQLASCHIFQGLTESELDSMRSTAVEIKMEKEQWLFRENQKAEALYVLKEGAVELLTVVNGKFEIPISITREPGSAYGIAALLEPYEYTLSARCAESGIVFQFNRGDLEKVFSQNHELGCKVMKNLAGHLLHKLRETRKELKVHFRTLFVLAH